MKRQHRFVSRWPLLAGGCLITIFPTTMVAATIDVVGGQATYIQGNANTNVNFGSASQVLIELDTVNVGDGSGVFRGLLSFTTLFGPGADQIPLGSSIESATLWLQTNNPSFDTIGAYMIRQQWSEQTVTWQSFNNGGAANIEFDGAALALFSAPGVTEPGPLVLLDLTAAVGAWSAGRSNFGIFFINPNADQWSFSSDNASVVADRPRLTVVYQPIPEPHQWLLLTLGMVALLRPLHSRPSPKHA